MTGRRRNGKEWREGLHLYGIAVELQNPQPTIAPVTMPASAQGLGIESHLMDFFTCRIGIRPKPDMFVLVIRTTNMAGEYHLDILGRFYQLFPNRLAIIAVGNGVAFFFNVLILIVKIGVGKQDHGVIFVFF